MQISEENMDKTEFINAYWKYYLLLENEVINTDNYVQIDECNYGTFSLEYFKVMQSLFAEIETMFKLIVGEDKGDIGKYRAGILENEHYEKIVNETLTINGNISISPFKGWDSAKLSWWDNFQSIKHKKDSNFKSANLENTLNMLSALYILNVYYYNKNFYRETTDASIPLKMSKLFTLTQLQSNVISDTMTIDNWNLVLHNINDDKVTSFEKMARGFLNSLPEV
jgi:hypothetical protein